uniref:Uncharacterized protein n=1 Tax=Anopheles maculatus TaxID=74869 RepID=A0A182T2U6_9DIPT
MEDQHKPTPKSDKVFSFLSQDEVEKLRQEEERKIAILGKDRVHQRFGTGDDEEEEEDEEEEDDDDIRSGRSECEQPATDDKSDINDNNMRNPLAEIDAVFRS